MAEVAWTFTKNNKNYKAQMNNDGLFLYFCVIRYQSDLDTDKKRAIYGYINNTNKTEAGIQTIFESYVEKDNI